MIQNSVQAHIFLGNERGCSLDEKHRSFHTFNYGSYWREGKASFFDLHFLNDVTVVQGATLDNFVHQQSDLLLIPIVGDVLYEIKGMAGSETIAVGNWRITSRTDVERIALTNPESDLINFLAIGVNGLKSGAGSFQLDKNPGVLIPLFPSSEKIQVCIGKYAGREEGSLQTLEDGNIFFFVISGVFEVANRLLSPRDGLTLGNCRHIEFEALSSEAILLVIQQKGESE